MTIVCIAVRSSAKRTSAEGTSVSTNIYVSTNIVYCRARRKAARVYHGSRVGTSCKLVGSECGSTNRLQYDLIAGIVLHYNLHNKFEGSSSSSKIGFSTVQK